MLDFIDSKISTIYNDFLIELDKLDTFCELKKLRFNATNLPNYNDRVIQQLYLLRYFPAYLIEYYSIYKRVIETEFVKTPYRILSLGTGCGIDYWGLKFAMEDKGLDVADYVYYTGVDKIEWDYREYFDNNDCKYLDIDISDLDGFKKNYNIIIFPKSIGEFSRANWLKIKELFSATQFRAERIAVISSIRETRDAADVRRMKEIIEIFKSDHNYSTNDNINGYYHFNENVGFKKYFSEFDIPNEVIDFIAALSEQCPTYLDIGESCYDDCNTLNRLPIMKTGHVKYQIINLEKDEGD